MGTIKTNTYIRFADDKLTSFEIKDIELTQQLTDLKNVNESKTAYTIPIELPITNETQRIFGNLRNINNTSTIQRERINCQLIQNNKILLNGYCYVDEYSYNKLSIVMVGNDLSIFNDLKDIYLTDLDFYGITDVTPNQYTFYSNMSNKAQNDVVDDYVNWVHIDWLNVGSDNRKADGISDFYVNRLMTKGRPTPVLNMKKIFDKIFEEAGYTYEASQEFVDIFSQEKMTTTVSEETYLRESITKYHFNNANGSNMVPTVPYGNIIYFRLHNGQSKVNNTTWVQTSEKRYELPLYMEDGTTYTFDLSIEAKKTLTDTKAVFTLKKIVSGYYSGDGTEIKFEDIIVTGSTIDTYTTRATYTSSNKEDFGSLWVMSVELDSGVLIYDSGQTLASLTITGDKYTYNNTVHFNDLMPVGISQLDFVNFVLTKYNIYIYADLKDKYKLYLKTQNDFYIDTVKDWSTKIDLSDIEIDDLGKRMDKVYTFEPQCKDLIGTEYKTLNASEFGSLKLTNPNSNSQSKENKITNKFESGIYTDRLSLPVNNTTPSSYQYTIMSHYSSRNSTIITGFINRMTFTNCYNYLIPYDAVNSLARTPLHLDVDYYLTLSPFMLSGYTTSNTGMYQMPYAYIDQFYPKYQYITNSTLPTITNNTLFNKFWYDEMNNKLFGNRKYIKIKARLTETDTLIENLRYKIYIKNDILGDCMYRINSITYSTDPNKLSEVELISITNYNSVPSTTISTISKTFIGETTANTSSSGSVSSGGSGTGVDLSSYVLTTTFNAEVSATDSDVTSLSTSINTTNSNVTSLSGQVNTLSSAISTETSNRISGDGSLSTGLSNEINTRSSQVNTLSSAISTETSSRITGDASLTTSINTTNSNLTSLSTNLSTNYYDKTNSDNRFVNTAGDTMTGDLTINADLNVTGASDWCDLKNIYNDTIKSHDYTGSGFADAGFIIYNEAGERTMVLDKLIIRDMFRAFVFEMSKIQVTNASLMVTDGTNASTDLLNDGNNYFEVANDNPFAVGDYIMAKNYETAYGYTIVYYVDSIVGKKVYVTEETSTGISDLEGITFGRIGNAIDYTRQGFIFLEANGIDSPTITVYDQVSGPTFNNTHRKVIMGDIPQMTLPDGTIADGYGFYGENGYLIGFLWSEKAYLGGLTLSTDGLRATNSITGSYTILNSQTGSLIGVNNVDVNVVEIMGEKITPLAQLNTGTDIEFPLTSSPYVIHDSNYTAVSSGYYTKNLYLQSNDTGNGNTGMILTESYSSSYNWYVGANAGKLNINGRIRYTLSANQMGGIEVNLYIKTATRTELIKNVKLSNFSASSYQLLDFNYVMENVTEQYVYLQMEQISLIWANNPIHLYTNIDSLYIYSNASKVEIGDEGIQVVTPNNYFRVDADATYFVDIDGTLHVNDTANIDYLLDVGSLSKASDTYVRARTANGYTSRFHLYGNGTSSNSEIYMGRDGSYGAFLKYNGSGDYFSLGRRNAGTDYDFLTIFTNGTTRFANYVDMVQENTNYSIGLRCGAYITRTSSHPNQTFPMIELSNANNNATHLRFLSATDWLCGVDDTGGNFGIVYDTFWSSVTSSKIGLWVKPGYADGVHVGIGTNSPNSKLHILSDTDSYAASHAVLEVTQNGNSTTNTELPYGIKVNVQPAYQSNAYCINFTVGGTNEGDIQVSSAGTLGFVQASDVTLKTNIIDTELDALNMITSLKVVDFNWKDTDRNTNRGKQTGVIAQQVADYIPEMVVYGSESLAVMYDVLHPYYIRSIQQLNDKIIELEKIINSK